jgi:hypothetical protein
MTGFKKATRQAVRLKIGLQGPSGAGKTWGALALARAIVGPMGKIALVDTENGSASLYSDRVEFDALDLAPPYTSKRYISAIAEAAEGGYDLLILDSISHQWIGEGGILSRKEALDKQGGNSYTNWATFTTEHEGFKAAILNAPLHLIATLRSKQDYVIEQNERGKATPRKVGMAAVQREGMEYEFSAVFDLQMSHRATVSKDRTGLFDSEVPYDLSDKRLGKLITDWLRTAKPLPTPEEIADAAERTLRESVRLPGGKDHFKGYGGQLVREVPSDALEAALEWMRKADADGFKAAKPAKYSEATEAIGLVLADRASEAADAELRASQAVA